MPTVPVSPRMTSQNSTDEQKLGHEKKPARQRLAPWTSASPETPFVLAHGLAGPPSPLLGSPSAALLDPFEWKLTPTTAHRTIARSRAEKFVALEACDDPTKNPWEVWGALVSSSAEVECAAASKAAFLCVPGEICRQADVLDACRSAGVPVILERGPFLPPADLLRAAEKICGKDGSGPALLLMDAGSVNGYSDRVFDPRALWMLKDFGVPVGVNLGDLLSPENAFYEWKATWTQQVRFLEPLVLAARALGVSCYLLPVSSEAGAGTTPGFSTFTMAETSSHPSVRKGAQ